MQTTKDMNDFQQGVELYKSNLVAELREAKAKNHQAEVDRLTAEIDGVSLALDYIRRFDPNDDFMSNLDELVSDLARAIFTISFLADEATAKAHQAEADRLTWKAISIGAITATADSIRFGDQR